MICAHRDVLVDYRSCTDEAEYMVHPAPVSTSSGMWYFENPMPMCGPHMLLAAKGTSTVYDLAGVRVEKDFRPMSGERRSCVAGHMAVGWCSDGPCFVCGGPGERRDIFSLSHSEYYGDPLPRWRVEGAA